MIKKDKFWSKRYNKWIKNLLEVLNNRLDQTEEKISGFGDWSFEIIKSEEQIEKNNKEKWKEPKGLMGHY